MQHHSSVQYHWHAHDRGLNAHEPVHALEGLDRHNDILARRIDAAIRYCVWRGDQTNAGLLTNRR